MQILKYTVIFYLKIAMEINDETGVIDIDKLRTQFANSTKLDASVSTNHKYKGSPFENRNLETVVVGDDLLVTGPLRLQHEEDRDMTYDIVSAYDGGVFMEPYRVSQFDLKRAKSIIKP